MAGCMISAISWTILKRRAACPVSGSALRAGEPSRWMWRSFSRKTGNQVFLVEQFPAVGRDLDLFSKVYMGDVLAKHQAEVYTSHRLVEVRPDSFVVSGEQGAKVLEFDCAYICLGLQSNTPPAAMQQDLQQSGIACSTIGDSRRARRIYEGIHEGRSVVDTLKALGFYE